MKDFSDLNDWTPKKLRTLRNNINNRLESFSSKRLDPKELQKSHALFGLDDVECKNLLVKVKKLLKPAKEN